MKMQLYGLLHRGKKAVVVRVFEMAGVWGDSFPCITKYGDEHPVWMVDSYEKALAARESTPTYNADHDHPNHSMSSDELEVCLFDIEVKEV